MQRERIGSRKAIAGLVLAAALALSLPGCTGPRIRITSSDAAVLRAAPALEVVLVPAKKGERAALSEAATAALVERARESLRAKGHPTEVTASAEGDPLPLELALLEEQVSRRTYTADTDANGVRLVKRTEAIVALRALAADGETVLWHCEARGLLTEPGRPFGPTEAELFERLLDRALARIPARP